MRSLLQVVPVPEQSPVLGSVRVRALVIDSVSSRHSRRVYARALDDFQAAGHPGRPPSPWSGAPLFRKCAPASPRAPGFTTVETTVAG
jgi:hypothetical protein